MGKPEITVSGRAQEFCLKADIKYMQLSLADEDNHAIAMVLLET